MRAGAQGGFVARFDADGTPRSMMKLADDVQASVGRVAYCPQTGVAAALGRIQGPSELDGEPTDGELGTSFVYHFRP